VDHKSFHGFSSTPWKGKLRSSNIVHGSSQTSSRNSHLNGQSSDSEKSVGEESRIISVIIPGAWIAKKTLKTPNTKIHTNQIPCTKIHIWWFCSSSLHIHGESYTGG
jgi:hypothetical protein